MFVFGGYIDMRGATNELWQYELGESVSIVSSLLTTVFESALSMLRGFSGLSRLIIQQKNPNFVWVLLIQSCCDCGDSIFLRKGRFSFFFIYLLIYFLCYFLLHGLFAKNDNKDNNNIFTYLRCIHVRFKREQIRF